VCKKSITNSQPFVKKMKNIMSPRGVGFFYSHCRHHRKMVSFPTSPV